MGSDVDAYSGKNSTSLRPAEEGAKAAAVGFQSLEQGVKTEVADSISLANEQQLAIGNVMDIEHRR